MAKTLGSLAILVLAPVTGLCQNDAAPPRSYPMCHAADVNRSVYTHFFEEMMEYGQRPLNAEVYAWLKLSDQDRDALIAISRDLADRSCVIDRAIRSVMWEARMEAIESGKAAPGLQKRVQDLNAQWDRAVIDHVKQLKAVLGGTRFQMLEDFLHTGKSLYETLPVLEPRPARRSH